MKTLTRSAPKFWIWTSKIMPDLWLVDLFCPIKKISTLHPTGHPQRLMPLTLTLNCYASKKKAIISLRSLPRQFTLFLACTHSLIIFCLIINACFYQFSYVLAVEKTYDKGIFHLYHTVQYSFWQSLSHSKVTFRGVITLSASHAGGMGLETSALYTFRGFLDPPEILAHNTLLRFSSSLEATDIVSNKEPISANNNVQQGGVWNFFLIGQNRSTNQRSGMILEV